MTHLRSIASSILLLVGFLLLAPPGRGDDSAGVRAGFADPPREYSTAPLWVWNDRLTDERVRATLNDLSGQGVKQAFVHPRPGLMTPYLSEEWFRLWNVALEEAARLDMNLWIYDENSYPSGFAGGLVPEAMPESLGLGLEIKEAKEAPKPSADILGIWRLEGEKVIDLTAAWRGGQVTGAGTYLVAGLRQAPVGGWFGGKTYVDLLRPGVTQKFIELTMEPYARAVGREFGKRVPGWFTDEPHLAPAGGLHWTPDLPDRYRERWKRELMAEMPGLTRQIGDWRRVRHNYQQLLLELFVQRWAKPCHDWAEAHGIEFTGHYWEHGWPGAGHGPDNMAMYAWHQRPAIDILMNQYREDVHAQFGNVRALLELSSVANQLGRARTLCEAYGAGGWDLRFEDMKRIGDWLYALGVNTLDEHLSYVTIRGARKRDHPQSFSYHAPWWDSYHVLSRYFARLSLALSRGEQVNSVLLLEPTTSLWMIQGEKDLDERGNAFQALVTELAKAQVEFDLGSEEIMARHGRVAPATNSVGPRLVIGRREYDAVVLPAQAENLNGTTLDLLERYAEAGGSLLLCGDAPARVDGAASDRAAKLTKCAGMEKADRAALAGRLAGRDPRFRIARAEHDAGILYHHRRRLSDGEVLFLSNASLEAQSRGRVIAGFSSVERLDPFTGAIAPLSVQSRDGGVEFEFDLPPSGSLLVMMTNAPAKPVPPRPATRVEELSAAAPLKVARQTPNVLALDYLDVEVGGETRRGSYFSPAANLVFAKHGLTGNPWSRSVQFRDELIRKTFPAESGFVATYRFVVEGAVPRGFQAVVERPELYEITCNGQGVKPVPGAWWLDRAFGRIDLAACARVGENELRLRARPMTIEHELEPVYLLGEFGLRPAERGFVVVPPADLGLGPWKGQGMPLYGGAVVYSRAYAIASPSGRYLVELGKWHGAVAKVTVNGQVAGHIFARPWECDITGAIRPGENVIEVTVIGTLKNTLGPHHAGDLVGSAWPAMFEKGPESGPPPGAAYHVLDYGLFEPFTVRQVK